MSLSRAHHGRNGSGIGPQPLRAKVGVAVAKDAAGVAVAVAVAGSGVVGTTGGRTTIRTNGKHLRLRRPVQQLWRFLLHPQSFRTSSPPPSTMQICNSFLTLRAAAASGAVVGHTRITPAVASAVALPAGLLRPCVWPLWFRVTACRVYVML